jgi:toxin ParE1/3/4
VRRLRLSIAAERDLRIIFADSEGRFGSTVAGRYRRLVSAALRDLRADAERAGVQTLDSGARVYHLRHSRRRLPRGRTVARPRHLLAFRIIDGGIVVLRVLHDAMDLPAHLKDV